jgi:hypothetical protein
MQWKVMLRAIKNSNKDGAVAEDFKEVEGLKDEVVSMMVVEEDLTAGVGEVEEGAMVEVAIK